MAIVSRIGDFLSDDRLLFNLIAIHVLLVASLVVPIVLRRLLVNGSNQLVHMTGLHWLNGLSQEAGRRLKAVCFWATLGAMTLTILGGCIYHFAAGRDVRADFEAWYAQLTWRDAFTLGRALAELCLLGLGIWLGTRQLRRWLPRLQDYLATHLVTKDREESLRRWFLLLERYGISLLCLGALWCALQIIHMGPLADTVVGFLTRVVTIVSIAKLLTLSCRTLSHALSAWGDRQLGKGKFRNYWERVTRLFPFGERCFEAAVYVSAASMCIRELEFIAVVADYGSRLVECIGIFFGTRVVIELLTVLLNEAFGLYDEERPLDQKGQTLVPLLQSVGQYVLYFGSGVMIMGVLGVPTSPILAGAGILGLAGGLGAQSLVTDVVSGFFILFENQYLVGDYVKVNDAAGRIEAVSIRHTQVRDDQGRLHIIPNGQIKSVVNYSKGYVIAEVDYKVPADRNVSEVFQAMIEAGRRLRKSHREVLGDTVIKGLVDLTPSDMIIRAVTRVQPGTHLAMQSEYRRMLKEVFDEQKAAEAQKASELKAAELKLVA
ncbi:MAG: mechanosensitive ion channel family protein [Planctomycetes bacterium]|nr:mechanosensitive ion channel family protein [Planctomycetota bacterium]